MHVLRAVMRVIADNPESLFYSLHSCLGTLNYENNINLLGKLLLNTIDFVCSCSIDPVA